jgi:ribosomal protein S8
MNKSQIYLLLAVKSASTLQKEKIQVSLNKVSIPFLITLYKHGIIQNFILLNNWRNKQKIKILIYLRYFFNKSVCKNLKFFSKPSLFTFLPYADICLLYDKKHTLFLSTSSGILTNLECKIKKIGGVALFKC